MIQPNRSSSKWQRIVLVACGDYITTIFPSSSAAGVCTRHYKTPHDVSMFQAKHWWPQASSSSDTAAHLWLHGSSGSGSRACATVLDNWIVAAASARLFRTQISDVRTEERLNTTVTVALFKQPIMRRVYTSWRSISNTVRATCWHAPWRRGSLGGTAQYRCGAGVSARPSIGTVRCICVEHGCGRRILNRHRFGTFLA